MYCSHEDEHTKLQIANRLTGQVALPERETDPHDFHMTEILYASIRQYQRLTEELRAENDGLRGDLNEKTKALKRAKQRAEKTAARRRLAKMREKRQDKKLRQENAVLVEELAQRHARARLDSGRVVPKGLRRKDSIR